MTAFADELEALLHGSGRCVGLEAETCGSTFSARSLRAWAFMSGVDAFFRCGFVIGDLPTLALDLAFAALVFLVLFPRSLVEGAGCGAGTPSRSIPSGELVVVTERPRSKTAMGSDWACNAGEVSGLKYALGTVNAWSMGNWLSNGVTAGDTKGVNDICRGCQSRGSHKMGSHQAIRGAHILLVLDPLVSIKQLVVLVWWLLGLRIEVPVAGLYLEALGGRGDHPGLLLGKEGDALLL